MAGLNDAPWLAPSRRKVKLVYLRRRRPYLPPWTQQLQPASPKTRRKTIYVRKRRQAFIKPSVLTVGMATLTVQHVSGGLVPVYSAATGAGDKFLNTSGAILNVVN